MTFKKIDNSSQSGSLQEEVRNLKQIISKLQELTAAGYQPANPRPITICSNCGRRGHAKQECRYPGGDKEGQPFPPRICHWCCKPSHLKHKCPNLHATRPHKYNPGPNHTHQQQASYYPNQNRHPRTTKQSHYSQVQQSTIPTAKMYQHQQQIPIQAAASTSQ